MAPRVRSTFATLSTVAAFVFALLLVSPVQASSAGSHCVARLSPIAAGQTSSKVLSFRCYATMAASLSAATNGRINLSGTASKQLVSQAVQKYEQANAVTPQTLNILAIFYVDANYGGNSLVWQTGGPSCSTGVTYGMTSMPGGWNDVISSVLGGYYGCSWYRLWQDNNYGGASQCYTGNTSYVGSAMNDQTSSVYVRTYNNCV